MPITRALPALLFVVLLAKPQPVRASWDRYAGDIVRYHARNIELNPQWVAKIGVQSNRFVIECAIPLRAVGIRPEHPLAPLRFNLAVLDQAAARWTWSATFGRPEDASRFRDLPLQSPPPVEEARHE